MIMGTVMKILHNAMDFGTGIQEACANISLDCSGDQVIVDEDLGASVCQSHGYSG